MSERARPAAMIVTDSTIATSPATTKIDFAPDRTSILWVIGALILVVAPHLPRLPIWYGPLLVLAIIERLSHFHMKRRPLPILIKLCLIGACLVGLAMQYGTVLGQSPGVALLCVMLALKLLECHSKREVYLVVTLSYFVVVTQFLFSQKVGMLIYMTGTVVVITGALLVLEMQPNRAGQSSAKVQQSLLPQLRTAGWLLLQCLPIMALLFVFFPRLTEPLWGTFGDEDKGKTGISDEMTPGQIGQLFLDDSPALRVSFEGQPPPRSQWYWRGPVLWNFDGQTWRRPDLLLGSSAKVPREATSSPSAISYEVTQEPSSRRWLFGLDVPIASPRKGRLQSDHTLQRRKPVNHVLSYPLISDPNYVMDPDLNSIARYAALRLPEDSNPRSKALAKSWRDEHNGDSPAIANRALRMFREQEFFYTFEPPPLAGHRVDDFLFNTRAGYCEYYSSAFVVLMRSAGVPARVATGYQGGYYNPNGNYVLVRNSDAHAWAEIWIEGRGWLRIDPTAAVAPERIDRGALAAIAKSRGALDYDWLRSMRNKLDGIQFVWNEWVLKFNSSQQSRLFRSIGIDQLDQRYLVAVLIALLIPFVGFMMYWLIRAQRLAGTDEVDRLYHRFCAHLARRGAEKMPSEGPVDFAQRATEQLSDIQHWIDRFTAHYVEAKYQAKPNPSLALEMRKLLRHKHH